MISRLGSAEHRDNTGAAIDALARTAAVGVWVVDVGVVGHVDTGGNGARFTSRRVRAGTRNIAEGPAMSVDELAAAIDVGLEVADAAAARGVAVLACGDMGIGNTTAASAMTAALASVSAAEVTGHGTGIDEDTFRRKVDVVTRALRVNQPGREPLDVLRTVGGLEIAAIVGACIGAAGRRMAIVGDGLIRHRRRLRRPNSARHSLTTGSRAISHLSLAMRCSWRSCDSSRSFNWACGSAKAQVPSSPCIC